MKLHPIELTIQSAGGTEMRTIEVGSVGGVRFSSRDVHGMRKELDAMLEHDGKYSAATRTNPSLYRIGRYLLTQADTFEVQSPMSGGEAEVVAIRDGMDIFITVGSDQCDRELDPLFADKPKQLCPHPIASVAWPYEEVRDHWDDLQISSVLTVGSHTVPLQDSPLSSQVDLEYLLAMDQVKAMPDPMVLFGGSVSFLDSVEQMIEAHHLPPETALGVADQFLARLYDPKLDRTIEHQFQPIVLGDDIDERNGRPEKARHHLSM